MDGLHQLTHAAWSLAQLHRHTGHVDAPELGVVKRHAHLVCGNGLAREPLGPGSDRAPRHAVLVQDVEPLLAVLLRETGFQAGRDTSGHTRLHHVRELAVNAFHDHDVEEIHGLERLHEVREEQRAEEEPFSVCAAIEPVVRDPAPGASAALPLRQAVCVQHAPAGRRGDSVKTAHREHLSEACASALDDAGRYARPPPPERVRS